MYPKWHLAQQAKAFDSRTVTSFGSLKSRRMLVASLAFAAMLGFFITMRPHGNAYDRVKHHRLASYRVTPRGQLADIRNQTLGFERIFAINLPERSDKRDAMALQARLSNFSVDFQDGILGSTVLRKAIPDVRSLRSPLLNKDNQCSRGQTMVQDNATIGQWRAHLDVLNKILRENIQTALIFEDDADWDIDFKLQMEEFARGSRWLLYDDKRSLHSPYGDNWDVLHLGHCHSEPRAADDRRWVISRDPAVPAGGLGSSSTQPSFHRWGQGENSDAQARVVYMQHFGYCAKAYAVSRRAAQRILLTASLLPFNMSIDKGLGTLCQGDDFPDFNCIAPSPPLVGKVIRGS